MSTLLLQSLGVVCPACEVLNPPASATCKACQAGMFAAGARPANKDLPPGMKPLAKQASSHPLPSVGALPTPARLPASPPAGEPLKPLDPPVAAKPAPKTPPPPPGRVSPPPPPSHLMTGAKFSGAAFKPPEGMPLEAAPTDPAVPGFQPAARASSTVPLPGPGTRAAPVPLTTLKSNQARFTVQVLAGSHRGQVIPLSHGTALVGRLKGTLALPNDPHVSPQHATFLVRDGQLWVRDENSASGVYVTVHGDEPVTVKGQFCVGERLFRFAGPIERAKPPTGGKLIVYGAPPAADVVFSIEELLVGHRVGRIALCTGPVISIGTTACDLSYPGDGSLAARHCELLVEAQGATLKDLSGGLGTYTKLGAGIERPLGHGDRIRVGSHILQVTA